MLLLDRFKKRWATNKWAYFVMVPFFASLAPASFTPHQTPIDPDGGHRYTLFSLSGTTMGALFVLSPLIIMIALAIFEWLDKPKVGQIFWVAICSCVTWGLFLVECRDSLNYHLDKSRMQITQATVLDSRIEDHNSRLPAYLKVQPPESEKITFRFRRNTKNESYVAPKSVDLIYGKGFFNRPSVSSVKGS